MQYIVFTDGARDQHTKVASIGYLIKTGNEFITQKACRVKALSARQAEIFAVGLAANWLMKNKNINKTDSVIFCIDCRDAIIFFRPPEDTSEIESKLLACNTNLKELLACDAAVKDLSDKCNVSFSKMWAHDPHHSEANGNSVADKLAKYALRARMIK